MPRPVLSNRLCYSIPRVVVFIRYTQAQSVFVFELIRFARGSVLLGSLGLGGYVAFGSLDGRLSIIFAKASLCLAICF